MLIWIAVIAVTVFLDQLTKYLTILHLKPVDTVPIIEDVLHLTYVENTGAAFGMMKDARWVFMVTSTVAIIAILGYMVYRTYIKKERMPWMEALSLSFIVGGGIGNMIDRTALGYVVDMIDLRLINFAVFNVADSFVCVGAGLMVLYLILLTVKEYRAEKEAQAENAAQAEESASAENAEEPALETVEGASASAAETEMGLSDQPAEPVEEAAATPEANASEEEDHA